MDAPRAPAAAAPIPIRCRRVTVPLYQKSSAWAQGSSCQSSFMVSLLLLTPLPVGERRGWSWGSWPPLRDGPEPGRAGGPGLPDLGLPVTQGHIELAGGLDDAAPDQLVGERAMARAVGRQGGAVIGDRPFREVDLEHGRLTRH